MQTVAATVEIRMEFPQKINSRTYDPVIPSLGIYLNKSKTLIQKDTCIPMFTAVWFTIAKIWKQPKCPSTDEWIKKWCIYTMEYYLAIKRMNSYHVQLHGWPRLYCVKWYQSNKDKYQMILLICGIEKQNKWTKQK